MASHSLSIISIDGELYQVPDYGYGTLMRCFECDRFSRPEVIYIRLGNIYIPIYDVKLPRTIIFVKLKYSDIPANVNVISEATINKLLELEDAKKELERIEKERMRSFDVFDVFVKEKGKLAKIVLNREIRYVRDGELYVGCYGEHYAPDVIENKNLAVRVHVIKKLKYEDGNEEVIEEYVADGCRSVGMYESDDGYGIRMSIDVYEKPETIQVLYKAEYTMIPVSEITSKLAKEREEVERKITEEQKKIVLEDLQKRGFKIYKQGNEVVVEFMGEKSGIIANEEGQIRYKGKYSLLAKLLLV